MKNTRLILLAQPDTVPADVAQLFISSFKEVINVQSLDEIGKHMQANGCFTRLLLFNPNSDTTLQLLSLLARINKDNAH